MNYTCIKKNDYSKFNIKRLYLHQKIKEVMNLLNFLA
jgi:hypothetical protein